MYVCANILFLNEISSLVAKYAYFPNLIGTGIIPKVPVVRKMWVYILQCIMSVPDDRKKGIPWFVYLALVWSRMSWNTWSTACLLLIQVKQQSVFINAYHYEGGEAGLSLLQLDMLSTIWPVIHLVGRLPTNPRIVGSILCLATMMSMMPNSAAIYLTLLRTDDDAIWWYALDVTITWPWFATLKCIWRYYGWTMMPKFAMMQKSKTLKT